MVAELEADVRIDAFAGLLTIVLEPVLPVSGHADVVIHRGAHAAHLKRLQHLTAGHLPADHAETTAQHAHLQGRGAVAGARHEVDRAADTIGAIPQGIRALVDFDPLVGQEVDRFKVRKPVGVAEENAVDQNIDAPMMEIIA